MRVLFLVVDGLSPRHVDREVMPALTTLALAGGWSRPGGVGVMPSSTYPNHATFATGSPPAAHGIIANQIPTASGAMPSWQVGLSVPTLFDAMHAAGRQSAAVFGDGHLVGATGAGNASFLWPVGPHPDGVALDPLGYAKDRETAAIVVEAVHSGAELVFAQLNQPDTVAHIFGPDSEEALCHYGRTDVHVGTISDSLRADWDDWVAIVVSDHSQEPVTEPEPVDLHAAAAGAVGLGGLVLDDGAAAVAGGELAHDTGWLTAVDGVEGFQRVGRDVVLVWCGPGRYFSPTEVPVRGVHGSPRTASQVGVVTGGHPAAQQLGAAISHRRPAASAWAPTVAGLLGLPPTHRGDRSVRNDADMGLLGPS